MALMNRDEVSGGDTEDDTFRHHVRGMAWNCLYHYGICRAIVATISRKESG
jgi:hypothetical protein